jgi:hypothetical protein
VARREPGAARRAALTLSVVDAPAAVELARAGEHVALTKLQADALVTLDEELARSVEGLVETVPLDALGVTRAGS